MDIDILIPFHRDDTYFEQAIASLGNTRNVTFRAIFIDDRINNNQIDLKKFRSIKNYELLKTEGGQGYGEALRVGTTALDSEVVALFNSDDLIHPERFKKQILDLDKSEINIAKIVRINNKGKKSSSLLGSINANYYDTRFLLLGAYGANASWCMRKDWWIKNSFFDSDECLDWRIALKSFQYSSISYTSDPVYMYRKHTNQITANKRIDRNRFDGLYRIWHEFALHCGLSGSTRDIFEVMAVPWLGPHRLKFEIPNEWAVKLLGLLTSEPNEIKKDMVTLISRRMLLASCNLENSIKDQILYFQKGISELGPIARDLFI